MFRSRCSLSTIASHTKPQVALLAQVLHQREDGPRQVRRRQEHPLADGHGLHVHARCRLFATGRLGDMFPQNVIIGYGLIGSTLCLGMIQFFESTLASSRRTTRWPSSSSSWRSLSTASSRRPAAPSTRPSLGNWWPKKGRGLVFGLWTCHQYIGDIVAALATAAIVKAGFAWQWALLLPGIANGVWGVVEPLLPAELAGGGGHRDRGGEGVEGVGRRR